MIRNCAAPLVLACTFGLSPAAGDPATEVTYIANEGFLLETGGKKILFDALFQGETIDWCDVPSPDTVELMKKAAGPFEGIDLVLITHRHVDHFAPGLVLEHLASNPRAVVVGPAQVVSELRAHAAWTEAFDKRTREIDLELFGSAKMTVRGIRLEAHRIRHGAYLVKDDKNGGERNKHENVENIAYLVEVGGVKAMHFGDAFLRENADYLDGHRFPRQTIDLVFVEGWSEESLSIMGEVLNAGAVVFMHMPANPEQVERIARYVASKLSSSVIFREKMERRTFR